MLCIFKGVCDNEVKQTRMNEMMVESSATADCSARFWCGIDDQVTRVRALFRYVASP